MMTFSCPKCGNDLERTRESTVVYKIERWKCRSCNKFYDTKQLQKIIFAICITIICQWQVYRCSIVVLFVLLFSLFPGSISSFNCYCIKSCLVELVSSYVSSIATIAVCADGLAFHTVQLTLSCVSYELS